MFKWDDSQLTFSQMDNFQAVIFLEHIDISLRPVEPHSTCNIPKETLLQVASIVTLRIH